MKTCTICGEGQALTEYFYRDKKKEKLHAQCKSCYVAKRREIWREHYHKYGSQYRERAVERNRLIKQKMRQNLMDYLKDKTCQNCGTSDVRVLEFHHIDRRRKDFSITSGIHNLIKWDNVLLEISKCQILCANCHKIVTAEQQGWHRSVVENI